MAYNFFFLPPLYTFTISDPNNWLSFGVLLFVGLFAGNLAARVRAQADLAAARATAMTELYRFTGKLAGIARLDDILWAASFQIASMLKANVVILLPNPVTKIPKCAPAIRRKTNWTPRTLPPPPGAGAMASLPAAMPKPCPAPSGFFCRCARARALSASPACSARMSVQCSRRMKGGLLDALLDQTALAIERSTLVEQVDEAQVLAEADKLRVAMLTSLSHDLRTPLASILGAATTLIAGQNLYDIKQTGELLATIREEAERLDRFVGNLLDMSRLEAGVLGVKPESVDVIDLVETAAKRLARRLSGHKLELDFPADIPLVSADPMSCWSRRSSICWTMP